MAECIIAGFGLIMGGVIIWIALDVLTDGALTRAALPALHAVPDTPPAEWAAREAG